MLKVILCAISSVFSALSVCLSAESAEAGAIQQETGMNARKSQNFADQENLLSLAKTLFDQKRLKGAELVCKKIIEINPKNSSANVLLLDTLLAENNGAEAQLEASRALRLMSSDGEVVYAAARIYDAGGLVSKSNNLYQRAYHLSPMKTKMILGNARALSRSGKADDAVSFMSRQAERAIDSIDLWDGVLQSALDASNRAAARRSLSKLAPLIAKRKARFVTDDGLVQGAWRAIQLDQWDQQTYPEAMAIFVALDRGIEAIALQQLAARKFQSSPELFQQLKLKVKEISALQPNQHPKLWSSIFTLCQSHEKVARHSKDVTASSKLSLK